jgi:hypothetical protein
MADFVCLYEQYEIVCGLACGGPDVSDLTKLASDEFALRRLMKDMLDELFAKYRYAGKDGSKLFVLGIQV